MEINFIIYFVLLFLLCILVYYRSQPKKIENFISSTDNILESGIFDKLKKKLNSHNILNTEPINIDNKINNNNNNKLSNVLKDSLDCVSDFKENILNYINKNYEIFKSNNIDDEFGLEISTKFSYKIINYERISFFANFKLIKNNSNLLNDITSQFSGNKNTLNQIINSLNNNINKDGQLIYGMDFKNNRNRIYINYIDNSKYIIDGYEWNNNYYNFKKYKSLENKNGAIKLLTELCGDKIAKQFINIFPEANWDILLHRVDSRIKNTNNNAYYFSFTIDPILKNIFNKLKPLLLLINNNEKIIDHWYNCNKDNIISWVMINLDENMKTELNIYFIAESDLVHDITRQVNNLLTSGNIGNIKSII